MRWKLLFDMLVIAPLLLQNSLAAGNDVTSDMLIERRIAAARDYRLSNNLAAAVSELTQILRDHPDNFLAHYQLGLSYEAIGDIDRAVRHLERGRNKTPET